MKKLCGSTDLGHRDDGEFVQFELQCEDGSRVELECRHGTMIEIVNELTQYLKRCAKAREDAGKTYEPMPQPGVIREYDLSKYAVLPGMDGNVRIAFTLTDGSTQMISLTPSDAGRWREILDKVIEAEGH